MSNLNQVFIMGNLTRDPELRRLQTGVSVADMRMAVSESYRKDGETKEVVCYIDVVVWGKQAELVAQRSTKGSNLFVMGKLQLDTWEKDGEKHSRIRIRANRVVFISGSGVPGNPNENGGMDEPVF